MLVQCPWLAAISTVLAIVVLIWGTPEQWFYTTLGFAFLPFITFAALASLRMGVGWSWGFVGIAILIQAFCSSQLIPTQLLGGGAEFVAQLLISTGGMFAILFFIRRRILEWLEKNNVI